MNDQELRKLIEELQAEIQNTHTVDKKDQELLLNLDAEIKALLGRTDGKVTPVHPSTLKRLEEGLDRFEISHPELTTLLSRLLESLGNVGI
jgi:hypothetical protein